jgi:hypothetical protein
MLIKFQFWGQMKSVSTMRHWEMGCKCYRYIDILPLFYRFGFIYLVLQSLLHLLTHYFPRYLIIEYRIATRLVPIPHLPFLFIYKPPCKRIPKLHVPTTKHHRVSNSFLKRKWYVQHASPRPWAWLTVLRSHLTPQEASPRPDRVIGYN